MSVRVMYRVVELNGYTDGRPSWTKARGSRMIFSTREEAKARLTELQAGEPQIKFSVRRVVRK